MHRGCFVWTPKPPLSDRRTPRLGPARVRVSVLSCLGRAGRPPGRILVSFTFSCGRSWCPLCLLGHLRAGVDLFVVFPALIPVCAPLVSGVSCFPALGALGLGVLCPPPPLCWWFLFCFSFFVFFFFTLPRPPCLRGFVFSGPGCPGPCRLVPPTLCWCYFFLPSSAPPLSPAFPFFQPWVPWALESRAPPHSVCGLFFFSFFSFFFHSSAAPLSPAFRVFWPWVPWALASCAPPPPLVFCFLFLPSSAPPLCPAFRVFRPWVPWTLASRAPPPPSVCGFFCFSFFFFFLFFFFPLFRAPLASGVPCFLALGAMSLSALCLPPLSLVCFSPCRGVPVVQCCGCVSWALGRVGVCCCGPCALVGACVRLRSVARCPLPAPPPFLLLPVVLSVPAGAVLVALLSPVLPLVFAGCAPPPPPAGCGVLCCASSCFVSCGAAVCGAFSVVPGGVWVACVGLGSCAVLFGAVLCRAVLCCFCPDLLSCAAAFSAGSGLRAGSGLFLFLCSACALLCWCACVVALCAVLSCPCGAGWCFVLLPVVFECLLFGLAVLCCLLVGPGGSRCRVSVMCCGVSLGAVLCLVTARCAAWRCVVVRCVVLFCSVWCCRALCCVLGRCPSSWGPLPSGAVFCLVAPHRVCFAVVCCCVVLFAVVLCAVCALGCRAVRFLSSPPCAVFLCGLFSLSALLPCAVPRGAVLPRGAVASCPAALFSLFLAFVWFLLLENPLQNLLKYFFGF